MTDASGDSSAFDVLPAIDLRGGRVVRLKQGDFDQETVYGDDPGMVALEFFGAGARLLHVVDLDGARTGERTNASAVEAIVAAVGDRGAVEVAGGIRDLTTAAGLLALGVQRVVVGTAALADPEFAARLVAAHGAERVVGAIDVRNGRAVAHGWAPSHAGFDAAEAIERLTGAGITTFEVTSVEHDGLLEGPDLPLYERVVALRRGSIIASGGIASLDDLRAVRDAGCTGAILGRALYEGRLSLRDALTIGD